VAGFRSPFGALSGTGTSAFTEFSVRPYFVLDTPKNKYLTSKPEVSDNLSGLMTSVALGLATTIDKDAVLKWLLHNLLHDSIPTVAAWVTVGATVSDTATGLEVASSGSITDTAAVSADELKDLGRYTWVVEYTSGTSGEVLFRMTDSSPGSMDLRVGGAVGAATASTTTNVSDVTVNNTALGGGSYRLEVSANLATSGTINNGPRFGPNSTTAGETVFITKAWSYRSDLGGMQLNSKDGTDYLPTSGAAGYALRRDYSRLPVKGQTLGEPAGINLVPNSDLSAGWASAGATITPNNAVSLSGQTDAATVDLTTTGSSFVYQTCTVAASTLYTASWDGKPGTATAWVSAFYDESNGAWVARAEYTLTDAVLLANGWYRYSVQVTTPSGCTSMRVYPTRNDAGSGAVAGTQGTTDFAFVQLEAYHIDTSRIPTYGASEARAKDEASTVIADSIPGFIQGSGSIVFEGSMDYVTGGGGFPRIVEINDDSADNRVSLLHNESSGFMVAAFFSGGSPAAAITTSVASGTDIKIAARWADDDFASSLSGGAAGTDTNGSAAVGLTTVWLGDTSGVIRPIRISHLSIGPYASPVASPGWSNAQLAEISGA
jgi:hypothetical protein